MVGLDLSAFSIAKSIPCVSLLGENKIIGLSAKTLSQLENTSGADYVGCGAVFKSPTKDSSIIGVAGLNALCEKSKLPVVAIGGICAANIALLKSCKIAGVAVSSAILNAPNPYQASLTLKQALLSNKPCQMPCIRAQDDISHR